MVYTLYLTFIGSVIIFINLNHPVGLGMSLIVHTLLISVGTGLVGGNFWFSYILFLVFLGGVLVLFIYMTSLASNEQFTMGWVTLGMGVMVGGILLLGLIMLFTPSMETPSTFADIEPVSINYIPLAELVMKAYSTECYSVTGLLVFYLLYALLVCANIVGVYTGALRNFN